MIACTIIGDSIAVGLGQQMAECRTIAKVGISSGGWDAQHPDAITGRDTVVISLGSNDGGDGLYTFKHLATIRERIKAKRVIWIVPACSEAARRSVYHVADVHNDIVIPFTPGADGIHPRNYGRLALHVQEAV